MSPLSSSSPPQTCANLDSPAIDTSQASTPPTIISPSGSILASSLLPKPRAGLLYLPRELRLQILRYTDLIVPTGKFWWTDGIHIRHDGTRFFLADRRDEYCARCSPSRAGPQFCANHPYEQCPNCRYTEYSPDGQRRFRIWSCPMTGYPTEAQLECPCTSCYPPADRPCTCIQFPRGLLSISSEFHYDVMETLFDHTRIQLACPFARSLEWLQQFPHSLLRRLRRLDLVLTHWDFGADVMHEKGHAMQVACDWAKLVNFMRYHLDLENLHLSLVAEPPTRYWHDKDGPGLGILAESMITRPLARLRDVGSFHVILGSDSQGIGMGIEYRSSQTVHRWRTYGTANMTATGIGNTNNSPATLIIPPPALNIVLNGIPPAGSTAVPIANQSTTPRSPAERAKDEFEAFLEKTCKGPDYNAADDGKAPPQRREDVEGHAFVPHRYPEVWSPLEEQGGRAVEWL